MSINTKISSLTGHQLNSAILQNISIRVTLYNTLVSLGNKWQRNHSTYKIPAIGCPTTEHRQPAEHHSLRVLARLPGGGADAVHWLQGWCSPRHIACVPVCGVQVRDKDRWRKNIEYIGKDDMKLGKWKMTETEKTQKEKWRKCMSKKRYRDKEG